MQDDPMKEKNHITVARIGHSGCWAAEHPVLLHCQVVSLTLLQTVCAYCSSNGDVHLPLFHL